MSCVSEEFERQLQRLRGECAGKPRAELVRLFLLALEREELVSVGYRESLMVERLRQMPIAEEVREIIHHALVWIWKDEEMHAIYIRGAIFRLGGVRLKTRAFLTQLAGGLAGWASSVLQHSRWTTAPVSRTFASLVAGIGRLVGKVPPEVRKHLRYGTFRDFCLFNIDAEQTAALCWKRIAELAARQPDLSPRLVEDFRRVAVDEERHRRVFEILAAALNGQDGLVAEETADRLAEKIAAVGPTFLPRSRRPILDSENPLGSGGRVWCCQGDAAEQKRRVFLRLLGDSDLAERLHERSESLGKKMGEMSVVIKPTFMLGYSRRDVSPITDPVLVQELANFLREIGCRNLSMIEGPNIYDQFFRNRTVEAVAEYFGFPSPLCRIVDASQEQVSHAYARGMAQYTIARTWKEADFRISFAKIRSHPIELALLSIGNVEWVGARCDEFLFIERQAERTTAVMMLLDEFPPHYALLDGYEAVPDGLVGVMGCARPRSPRRFYAGRDALAVDVVAARHLGVRDFRDSSLLRAAWHWFGGWSQSVEVIGTDEPLCSWRGPYSNEAWAAMSMIAYPVYVMGSGRGALFVPEMDPDAFPPLHPENLWLRMRRSAIRSLLGLRLPDGRGLRK